MPIYEYACGACNHRLEKLQKLADAPLVECPACRQPALKKQVSATGFQLKGTGWYATDFKPKNQNSSSVNSCPSATACGSNCPGVASSK